MGTQINGIDLDEVVKRLDSFAASDQGRLKVTVSDDVEQGEVKRQYHLGRCDVGSPWAKGCLEKDIQDDEQ